MSLWSDITAKLFGPKPIEPVVTTPQQSADSATTSKVEIISESFIPPGLSIGSVIPKERAAANSMSIRKTVAKYGRVDFPPGRIQLTDDIRLHSGCEINGFPSRQTPTTIGPMQESANVAARGDNGEWFSVFNTNVPAGNNPRVGERYGIPEGPSHNVTIKNLVIDCAFDDQINDNHGSKTTCQGVSIEGCGIRLSNVKIVNPARGFGGGECFPIRIAAPQERVYGASRTIVLGCEVTDPGYAGKTHNGGAGYEITCITVAGSPGNIIENPLIAHCRVYDMKRDSKQPSPIHAFHTAYTRGALITGNYVADVDGVGYYVDTGRSWNTSISGNKFLGVYRGVFLNAMSDFVQTDMEISGNTIQMFENTPGWMMDAPPAGIILQRSGAGMSAFNSIHFEGNRIIGRKANFKGIGSLGYYPRGFYFRFDNKASATNLSVFRNTIDVPGFDSGIGKDYYPQQPDSMAIYFASKSAWDASNPMVRCVDNRNPLGSPLMTTVVDEGFKPWQQVKQLA